MVRGVVGVPVPVVLMVPMIMVMVFSMFTMVAMSLMSCSMSVVLTMWMIRSMIFMAVIFTVFTAPSITVTFLLEQDSRPQLQGSPLSRKAGVHTEVQTNVQTGVKAAVQHYWLGSPSL